jgi:16S rRNA (cytosine967-C5)-methyltransferase
VAIEALVAVDEGARANAALPGLLNRGNLDQRDRGFATEVVYGTLRMRRACDWLVGLFARGELEPVVRAALRAGAYQLAFMRVPAHAAVSTTVAEVPERARGLVNAVLRRIAELVAQGPPPWPDLPTQLSYPDWVVKQLSADLGPGRALGALKQMNRAASPQQRPDGYVQDPGSQAVVAHFAAALAGCRPGAARVLDLCAAPGGKATALAYSSSVVVAVDLVPSRARLVVASTATLGLGNVPVVVADAARPPVRPASFGGVLVDAPCSGLGVLRRRPDARWRVRPEDLERLAALQRRLLAAAAPLVAPGGLLAYSVCTLTRAETVDIAEWSTAELPGWAPVEPPGAPWEVLGRGALLLPQAAGTDGMYLLVLRRP